MCYQRIKYDTRFYEKFKIIISNKLFFKDNKF
jgi:hypothetical protein